MTTTCSACRMVPGDGAPDCPRCAAFNLERREEMRAAIELGEAMNGPVLRAKAERDEAIRRAVRAEAEVAQLVLVIRSLDDKIDALKTRLRNYE